MNKTNYQFKTEPWEHQLLALDYLMQHKQAGLYTDMGTGKSKIIIDMIVNKGFKLVLIVCTLKSCNDVWPKQFVKHSYIEPQYALDLGGISSTKKIKLCTESITKAQNANYTGPLIWLVNYDGIWRAPFCDYLLKAPIDCVVCDESHYIKSPASKRSRFLTRLGKRVENRYLMTGTPFAENPLDVYAQYRFLDPSIFGTSYAAFKDRYQNLDAKASMAVGYPVLNKKQPYKNLDELTEKFYSIGFSIPSSVKLPAINDQTKEYRMSPKATRVYKQFCKDSVIYNREWYCEAENALVAQLRKKQIASGFVSAVNDIGEKKYFKLDSNRQELLIDILNSLPANEPVVIFAQFKQSFKQIKVACAACGRGYSELSGREDTEPEWQAGKTSVLAVQFSKGAESADFTRARYCIYYTMTNSLAQYEQSRKRVHRPGQTRPVYYIHFVAETDKGQPVIDSLIMEAVKLKKDITTYIMEKEGLING